MSALAKTAFPDLFERFVRDWMPLDSVPGDDRYGEFRDDLTELIAVAIDCLQSVFREEMGL